MDSHRSLRGFGQLDAAVSLALRYNGVVTQHHSASPGGANPALAMAVLAARVRAITNGEVELDVSGSSKEDPIASSAPGVIVDGRAFCSASDDRGLGPTLRWALTNGANRLTVIADGDHAGHLARRAGLISAEIDVWIADGPDVAPAEPVPVIEPPLLSESHLAYRAVMSEAGARPIDDHGMLIAEVAGLEVARVVTGDDGETARLDVGVGQADRELQQYIHGHLDDDANLRRAIAAVVRHRNPGSAAHPLSRLGRQRWLRSVLMDDPSLIGLEELMPVTPLRPRETLLGTEPTAAAGESVIVVCSVGVDLDLLPEAADYRNRENPDAKLIVVVPERDRQLVGQFMTGLIPRLQMVSIELPWESRAEPLPG